ncbi:GrpB family protein [Alkalihalobacillus pseudalcaliphilus]|uniref:GrpB family protein n=1 Tax=Alkalihalobacillus pseudalcaliphilus TaxID=79884 RepID=UPI00064D8060|nr:GrpB family protein [Alkalihalobacillus pseudalcaliphilus]KMK75549.1 glutamate-rich protein GrpB [Alkalihalobacillus pseudalcaliphilus]
MRKTTIEAWTSEWSQRYEKEETLLKGILKEDLMAIHHIGSTSIPTIGYAKPVIDILVVVKEIDRVDTYDDELMRIGYIPKGENGIKGRRYFPKGGIHRTHHLHIYQLGSVQIEHQLVFKKYLLHHHEEAKAYGELKLQLKQQFPHEHQKYQDGKQSFVHELNERAKAWGCRTEEGLNSYYVRKLT